MNFLSIKKMVSWSIPFFFLLVIIMIIFSYIVKVMMVNSNISHCSLPLQVNLPMVVRHRGWTTHSHKYWIPLDNLFTRHTQLDIWRWSSTITLAVWHFNVWQYFVTLCTDLTIYTCYVMLLFTWMHDLLSVLLLSLMTTRMFSSLLFWGGMNSSKIINKKSGFKATSRLYIQDDIFNFSYFNIFFL